MKKLISIASVCVAGCLGPVLAASTVTRSLSPTTYAPGSPITVTVTVTPDPAVLAYALQDTPPTGWTISNVDNSGNSVGGVVKWGLYFDNTARTLSYQVTPPAGTTGTKLFSGSASFDGVSLTIGGTSSIAEVPDTTAPSVSITAPAAGNVSGTVTVNASASDDRGVAGVQFKLDGANLGAEDTSAPYSTSWNSTTASLGAHQLTAVARDAAGNTTTSAIVNVTVLDGSAPTSVSLTAPAAGAVLSGNAVTLSGTASDNVGVTRIEFYTGATKIGEATAAPFSITWNTLTAANGGHSLTVKAYDAVGNVTTSAAVAVSVANAASNSAIRVLSAATYTSGTPVTVTINANPGANVQAYALQDQYPAGWTVTNVNNSGAVVGGMVKWGLFFDNTARTFTYQVTPPAGTAGTKTFAGDISFDGVSSAIGGTSSIASSVVDTSSPTVSITAPANNISVSGSISVVGTATDNIGVVGVQFKLDGVNLGAEDTSAPYSVTWNTTQSSNAQHTLTAVARDSSGNVRTSAVIAVVVNNAAPTPDTGTGTAESGFLPFKNVMIVNKDSGITINYTLADGTVGGSSAKASAVSGASLAAGSVALKVYDRLGSEVRTLGQGTGTGTNTYSTIWDGRNSNGELVASGTYILVLNQGSKVFKRKIVVIK